MSTEILTGFATLLYILGAICLIFGLRKLGAPDSAQSGNKTAALGMGLGVLAAIIEPIETSWLGYACIFVGLSVAVLIGYMMAKTVAITEMPEMVSLLNGFGGAAAMLLSLSELIGFLNIGGSDSISLLIFNLSLGALTLSGSMIAWAKLKGKIKDISSPFISILGFSLLFILLAGGIFVSFHPSLELVLLLMLVGLAYGYFFVMPIGGADMPVVISLLNSFSGITAMLTGAIFDNKMMLLGGTLVGAAGIILTLLMSKAMNRSVWNVLKGNFGGSSGGTAMSVEGQVIKEITLNDLAIQMNYAQKVMLIPGYGLAVAQAQSAVKELDQLLSSRDVEIRYGIHPVAGRMPGHMNVLLAESDISYDKLMDLEEANDFLTNCDVVIVVGANDVVNPSALDDKGSPLYGMPILEVTKAKQVVVIKRGMKPGYSGVENPLFYKDNNKMLFGDAKAVLNDLNKEIKTL